MATLSFESDDDKYNGYVKGRPATWEWAKNYGGYGQGHDFFFVHWQINTARSDQRGKSLNRNIVRLHVECPRYDVDRLLNDVKGELVSAILDSKLSQQAFRKGFDYRVGRRVGQIRETKCTEPIRVIIPESQLKLTHEENIAVVHSAMGSMVDKLVKNLTPKLDSYFGNA